MKNIFRIIALLALVFTPAALSAQDMIVKLDSTIIDGQVVEYNKSTIRIVNSMPPNDTLLLEPSEVHFIRYSNGMEQIVTLPSENLNSGTVGTHNGGTNGQAGIGLKLDGQDLYFQGLTDGKIYNKKYATLEMCGSCGGTCLLGFIGTGGAIAYALSPINPWNVKPPLSEDRLQNRTYVKGFQDGVKKARLKNIVIGSSIPIVIGVGVLIAYAFL